MQRNIAYLMGALGASLALTPPAWAVEVHGQLVVTAAEAQQDTPLAGARITVQDREGRRAPLEADTDAAGEARFPDLPAGEYLVEVRHPDHEPDSYLVQVEAGGEQRLSTLLEVLGGERVIRVSDRRLFVNARETSPHVGARDASFMRARITGADSMQRVLSTVPGLQASSVGQIHARGDHKSLTVSLDGVNLPIPMQSSTTNIVDPEFLERIEVRTGSYDASYGGQLGAVLNLSTPQGTREPFHEIAPTVGTFGTVRGLYRAGGASEDGRQDWFVGVRAGRTENRVEPAHPDRQTLNNDGTDLGFLARLSQRTDDGALGVTLSHASSEFGVPQTPNNAQAGVELRQGEGSSLALLSWKRRLSEQDSLRVGLSYLRSEQRIRHNGVFTPFTAVDPALSPELAAEGFPADPEAPGSPYLPTTSLRIEQLQPSLEIQRRLGDDHLLKAGVSADFIRSSQQVDILDAGGGGGLPNPTGVAGLTRRFQADLRRSAFLGGLWVNHSLPLHEGIQLSYGLRADTFDDGLTLRTGQISPLVNLSFAPADRQALRLSYNRLFQAPPLEVDAAGGVGALPQRTDLYEVSYEAELATATTGRLAYVHKEMRDQLDVALLIPNANIPVYAPTMFAAARYQGLELSLNTAHKTGWNGFLSATLSTARPLVPGVDTVEFPAFNDHDQRVQVAAGLSHTTPGGFSAAADLFYGSGFPQEALGLYNEIGLTPYGLTGGRRDRLVANLNLRWFPRDGEGRETGSGIALEVQNLFDQREALNFLSHFSGTRFVQGRRVLLSGILRW